MDHWVQSIVSQAGRSWQMECRWEEAVLCLLWRWISLTSRTSLSRRFCLKLAGEIFPERQDWQEDLNHLGSVFCCPYQFPCAIRQEVSAASVLPLFTTDGQRTRKQIPIDNLLSRAAGNGQCLGLVQAAQSTRGQGLPSCGSLTSLCSLSAETSTMQPVDLSPEEISCPLTSELPVIHQHNPMQKFNMKNG